MHQRIVVAGGGIGGLHFAAAAKAAGFRSVCVVERDGDVIRANAGGGLGLWPPSLACAHRIGALPALEGIGQYMPSAKYLDCRGRSLGQPSATFTDSKYPVLCLGRDRLLAVLYERCQHFGVDFVTGAAVETVDATVRTVTLADGQSIEYDVLVGADGIHSNVRRQIVAPHVTAQSCGYAYYRATTGGGTAVEPTWRTDTAFEAWGDGIRFGYVPLNPPEVFWFAAVPLADEPAGVTDRLGSRGAAIVKDSDTVDWLAGRFATWGNSGRTDGVDLSAMVRASVGDGILRTEICKVPNVTKFPWHAHGGRVVLLGDACHATAPNIAQGAGLSIEDGAELVHRLSQAAVASDSRRDFNDKPLERAMAAYATARKPRAAAVQLVADTIAVVGQQRGLAAKLRDTAMWAAARCFPGTTAFVFEAAVSFSLGGSGADVHWRPPAPSMVLDTTTPPTDGAEIDAPLKMVPNTAAPERAGVCRAAGLRAFLRLPDPVRRARQSASVLLGTGTASVAHPTAPFAPANVMLAALRRLFMLPQPTKASGFVAGVAPATVATGQREAWTRVFGWPDGSTSAAFTTTMRTRRFLGDDKRCPTGVVLLEGAGIHPWIDRLVSFGYAVTISAPKPAAQDPEAAGAAAVEVTYTSVGVWVGSCRLWFVPSMLLPRSSWREVVTVDALTNVAAGGATATWRFEDGAIAWPFASLLSSTPLMQYSGSFAESTASSSPTAIRKTPVLVTGGTGLLGEAVVAALVQSGAADVTVLTRDAANVARPVRGASYCSWDPNRPTEGGWRKLVTADTVVVNLAGENPGTKRWDASVKKRIVESRVGAIDAFKHVFAETGVAPRKFLQASALVPSAESGATSEGASFRRETVDAIAAAARAVGAADVTVLDIGILLSTEGGLCPHTRLAARLGATRTGDGTQVLPAIALDRAGLCVAEAALAGTTTAGTSPLTTRTMTVAEANIRNTDFLNALRVACRDAGAVTVPFGWVPVPSWVLRLMAGPSACVVLDSNVATTTTTAGASVDATAELRRAEALGPLLPFSSFFTGRR